MVRFVLFLNGGESRPHFRTAGLLPLHGRDGAAHMEAGDEGHALAGIAPVIHALHFPGLGQGCIA